MPWLAAKDARIKPSRRASSRARLRGLQEPRVIPARRDAEQATHDLDAELVLVSLDERVDYGHAPGYSASWTFAPPSAEVSGCPLNPGNSSRDGTGGRFWGVEAHDIVCDEPRKAFARIALALAIAAMGIYVASSDLPGGAVVGFLLMLAAVLFGVRTARSRLPTWAGRTAVAVGALIAAFAAFLIHSIKIEAPLFARSPGVPSVGASAPSPQLAAAVDRARPMVRTAIVEQNLPGVSIAVGIGGGRGNIVWAEGFGWRDVVTHTSVTPDTRFNIGTAAQVVIPAVASLGLTNTGTDSSIRSA